ncbi:hypothetical protein NDU88_004148, partial [Pleurodeles waltl]
GSRGGASCISMGDGQRGDPPEKVAEYRTNLSLIWNVAGVNPKVADKAWNSLIGKYDVRVFQETWAVNKVFVRGFTTYSVEALLPRKMGRSMGRLMILVRNYIVCWHELLRIDSPDLMGINLRFP